MKRKQTTQKGSLVYLNGGEDLKIMLNRVEKAGEKIALTKLQYLKIMDSMLFL